ncbi:ATG8G [Symbiodinium natans]|uniref:Autophagy-related protein n=1 Tax=Symbiodinium natans TaxID=878477 RepID=A0A812U1U9_9DINO|nr:ATG8G [Symbiodinium natans]
MADVAYAPLQESIPFEKRAAEASRILAKYPDRVPVICEKAPSTELPEIEKRKFLVPASMLCGEFKYIVHKHIQQASSGKGLAADQVIYLFTRKDKTKKQVKTGAVMSELYDSSRSEDGFLYIIYSAENTLGSN